MKIFYQSILLLFIGAMSLTTIAQRNCGSMHVLDSQQENDPKREGKIRQIEDHTNAVIANANRVVEGVITIPTVVHIVYNGSTENISDAQIMTQINVLNEDFRRLNGDANSTWAQAADSQIEFCLASVDPQGNSTNGITRTSTSVSAFGTNDNMKYTSSGGKDAWPASDYMNIWVCDISGGILGYAQFPGGSPATDGVVIDYQYFGTIGTSSAPFDLGRTATHEVGHWLNLRHIWGDGGCGVDDFVSDTPESDGANYGCATNHVSCGTTDMVQNYMDYSDDACMNLYTQGQKVRMRALFEPGGAKASLLNSNGCGNGTTPTCDDGIQNGNETGIDCGGSCVPCSTTCDGTEVTLTLNFDNYPEETSWAITQNGSNVASGGTYGSQADGSTLTQTICLADGCFDFVINDTYGDGICCSYGSGSYTLTEGSATIASGGSFTNSETTNFCVGSTPPTCTDGIMNGDETGVDCGGSCDPCPTCTDGIMNGDETGVDCGGSCDPCSTCTDGIMNGDETGVDCGGSCDPCPTCTDGIMNGDETGVDCGGSCDPCSTCTDGIMNGDETGVDCGGSCDPCSTCTDGIMNGDETGVDCGGSCDPCPTCTDGIMNGDETGVDCGGSCDPCITGCNGTEVTITIVLDNYPEETTWFLTQGATTVASGGTYGNLPDGSTFTEDVCLEDGCYEFIIKDAYGDGICCSYGNGSYSVTNGATTYASGGSFGSSETTSFCVGSAPEPTCTDGIMNGDETGVDCGGSSCEPCSTGCNYVTINSNNFDSNWGIWNDGGSDCRRSSNDAAYANSGSRCVRLRDNTGSSTTTTDNMNLTSYDELTVDFNFYARSMENNEDFWLQVSTNGGSSYTTIASWARGTDFNNNVRYYETVVIPGSFSSNTKLRFRCDASSNSDYIYIDDVVITGCVNNNTRDNEEVIVATTVAKEEVIEGSISDLTLYPNPVKGELWIQFQAVSTGNMSMFITDMSGKIMDSKEVEVKEGMNTMQLNSSNYSAGIYFVHLTTEFGIESKRFVVMN